MHTYIKVYLDTSNTKICPLVMILSRVESSGIVFLVLFSASKEALVPLANEPIMSKRSIWLFRHLKYQNPSINLEDIGRARMLQQFRRSQSIGALKEEYSWLRGCDVLAIFGIFGSILTSLKFTSVFYPFVYFKIVRLK